VRDAWVSVRTPRTFEKRTLASSETAWTTSAISVERRRAAEVESSEEVEVLESPFVVVEGEAGGGVEPGTVRLDEAEEGVGGGCSEAGSLRRLAFRARSSSRASAERERRTRAWRSTTWMQARRPR
jgi:hypothetical protein